jgi:catechol 2,3-dioxygenase-like lactoylglutathione lyase family enzyme
LKKALCVFILLGILAMPLRAGDPAGSKGSLPKGEKALFESIRTVAVYVTDLGRAKKFYTEALGFEVTAEVTPTLCFLRSRSGKISLYLEGGQKPAKIDARTVRLSFFLQTEQSAKDVYKALKAKGVKLLQEAPEPVDENTSCFQFEDPDGNILEVSGKP